MENKNQADQDAVLPTDETNQEPTIAQEAESIEAFLDYVENTNASDKIEVIIEYPQETKEEMIDSIIKINPDAVITDFMLNEYKETIKYNVPYNGVELVKSFVELREGFPCFVLTSFDDNAIRQSEDVNIVYVKNILHNKEIDKNSKASFLERVIHQINHYKSRINDTEARLLELIKLRSSGEASIEQEQEIIDLDHFLEMSIDKKSSVPLEYKSLSNTQKLEEILSKVDDLLTKVQKKNG